MQFAVLHTETGDVMGVGTAYAHPNEKATLTWRTGVRSVGVYDGIEAVHEMVAENGNLRMAYF